MPSTGSSRATLLPRMPRWTERVEVFALCRSWHAGDASRQLLDQLANTVSRLRDSVRIGPVINNQSCSHVHGHERPIPLSQSFKEIGGFSAQSLRRRAYVTAYSLDLKGIDLHRRSLEPGHGDLRGSARLRRSPGLYLLSPHAFRT